MKAQEYLDLHYPKEERKNIKKLFINNLSLEGDLDLSDFINLKEVYCFENKIRADLNIFSYLIKLEVLDLGINDYSFNCHRQNNNFYGSLKSLENLNNLKRICIGYNSDIKGGLKYLPLEVLESFGCHGTEFKEILKPFDYDIYAWKLVNHPNLFVDRKQLIEEKIISTNQTIDEIKKELIEPNKNMIEYLNVSVEIYKQKIQKRIKQRLESKLHLLQKVLTKKSETVFSKEESFDGDLLYLEQIAPKHKDWRYK